MLSLGSEVTEGSEKEQPALEAVALWTRKFCLWQWRKHFQKGVMSVYNGSEVPEVSVAWIQFKK